MAYEIEDSGPGKKTLKVTLESERVTTKLGESFAELQKAAEIKGFRRGKAPMTLIKKRFGEEVEKEVREELVAESFTESCKEAEIRPIVDPKIDDVEFDEEKGLSYTANVLVYPEFDLPDYKKIKATRKIGDVTQEEVDAAVNMLRERAAEFTKADDDVVLGGDDYAVIDVKCVYEGDMLFSYDRLPLNAESRGFREIKTDNIFEQLSGKKAGDIVELAGEFTPDVRDNEFIKKSTEIDVESLVGKEAALEVTLAEVRHRQLPGDDVFLEKVGFASESELRGSIEKDLEARKKADADATVKLQLIDDLVKRAEIPLPDELVEIELEKRAFTRLNEMRQQGLSGDEVREQLDVFKAESREKVVESIKSMFIIDEIAKKERIFVTEDDVDRRIQAMAASYSATPEQVRQMLEEREQLGELRETLKNEKVFEVLLKSADITEETDASGDDSAADDTPEKEEGEEE